MTRYLRAAIIDWIFEATSKLNIEDKSVIFQTVSLMDRYYISQRKTQPKEELQLVAVSCLFMASKNMEVEPIDLKTCYKSLCFKKYSTQ